MSTWKPTRCLVVYLRTRKTTPTTSAYSPRRSGPCWSFEPIFASWALRHHPSTLWSSLASANKKNMSPLIRLALRLPSIVTNTAAGESLLSSMEHSTTSSCLITFPLVSTREQLADMLTKPLNAPARYYLNRKPGRRFYRRRRLRRSIGARPKAAQMSHPHE